MEWTNFCLLMLVSYIRFITVKSESRPLIFWDPYQPVFACEDPTIHVKINDKLTFVCPDKTLSANPNPTSPLSFERAYLLKYGQEEAYNSCNATENIQQLLDCDPSKLHTTYTNYPYSIKAFATSPGALTFEQGKTYYAIGTSFRTAENIGNLVGGSCNQTKPGDLNQYKLRLKIHVCSDAEIANGTCNLCTSEGCYYKDCGKNCSNWSDVTNLERGLKCYTIQKRSCDNNLLQETKEEYREVNRTCPPSVKPTGQNCSNWSDVTNLKRGLNCYTIQKRSCDNILLQETKEEYREVNRTCPPTVKPTGAPRTGDDTENADTYKYLSVGLAVICLLIGIVLGGFCHKRHHEKSCMKSTNITPENGTTEAVKYKHDNGSVNYDNYGFNRESQEVNGNNFPVV